MDDLSHRSGCLGILLNLISGGRVHTRSTGPLSPSGTAEPWDVPSRPDEAKARFPYGLRDAFLSPAEISFFHVIKGVLPSEQHLTAKVNLADLFYVKMPNINLAARNGIDRKHVDFVVCDAGTMQPLLGIELDDSSHQRKDRQERDAFVESVFAAAALPLLRIPAARSYNPKDLASQIQALLTPSLATRIEQQDGSM